MLAYTQRNGHDDIVRIALVTGFCGAYTTFSAFSYETVEYFRQGAIMTGIVNIATNNVLALSAAVGGILLARR